MEGKGGELVKVSGSSVGRGEKGTRSRLGGEGGRGRARTASAQGKVDHLRLRRCALGARTDTLPLDPPAALQPSLRGHAVEQSGHENLLARA